MLCHHITTLLPEYSFKKQYVGGISLFAYSVNKISDKLTTYTDAQCCKLDIASNKVPHWFAALLAKLKNLIQSN